MSGFGKSFSFSAGASGSSGVGGGAFNQTGNSTGGLGFGASIEKRQRSGSVTEAAPFGTQSNSGPSSFGQNAFGAPSLAAAPAAGGGLFGSSQNATGGTASGGIFGSSSSAQPAQTTSLFGSSSAQPAQTTSLFGSSSAQPAQTTSLFGTAPAQPAQTTSLFGSSSAQPAQTTSLFGSSSTQPAQTTSLFGSSSAQPAQTTSLFGSSSAQPAQTTSLFGSSSAQPAQTTSLFGTAPAQPAQQPTMFGLGATGSTFNSQQQQQAQAQIQTQQQLSQQTSEAEELSKQIMFIKDCWDPALASYQFRHYFYNVAEPEKAHLYQCLPNQDPALWQQAQADNPDPSTLVPVLANGFEDLRKRVDSQSLQMLSYQDRTAEISNKLRNVIQRHHSETTVRLAECRRRQGELSQRLLEFMRLLQLLRLRGQLLHPEEEVFRVRVEHLEKEMARSDSLKQRLAGLQDHVYRLQATARRRRELQGMSKSGQAGDGYEVADESQLESVMRMLGEKQRGLAHLTQVMSQSAQSIEAIESAIEERYNDLQKQKEARERAQIARSLVRPW